MGSPTSSYATAGIALRVSGALKPHHHDKVETPSVEIIQYHPCVLLSHKLGWIGDPEEKIKCKPEFS
jgi:hypothetical protein